MITLRRVTMIIKADKPPMIPPIKIPPLLEDGEPDERTMMANLTFAHIREK